MVEVEPLGPLLAHGRTADVYAWRPGYIIKVFHDWFTLDDIEYEAQIGRAVHAAGLPAPLPGEILRIGGQHALVYERVDGPSMGQAVFKQPWRVASFGRRLAALHAHLHALPFTADIPPQSEILEQKIRRASVLPSARQSALLSALASMPAGDRLCHGDLHPGNVLVTPHGDIVIDWLDATIGNPLADLARSSVILRGDLIAQPWLGPLIRVFHTTYVREYFRLRPGGETEYRCWLPIVAAARLSENIPKIEHWLLKQASAVR